MRVAKALAFAVVVALAAQAIDIFFHFILGVTVHLPYISVKSFVIAFTLFWFSYWTGVKWDRGLIATITAAILFYIYYRYTEPTLDRTIFKIDEDFGFVFIHMFAIYLPYFLTWKFLLKKSE